MHPGLIGGIVGSVIGMAGGVFGTYCSIKNTKGPRERAFVIKASILCWVFVVAFVVGMALMPVPYKFWLVAVYVVGLVGSVLAWNKKQVLIRSEESKHDA